MHQKQTASRIEAIFLTEKDVANILSITNRTLQDWRQKGLGPKYVRVGRQIRYDLLDLEKWIASNKFKGDIHG